MNARDSHTLAGYIRHAEVYGSEAVFETALGDLNVTDLGHLSLRLQHLDSHWRLKACIKQAPGDFAAMLMDRGIKAKEAASMSQTSIKTARDHHQAGLHAEMRLESTL